MLGPQLNTDLAIKTTTKQKISPPVKKTTTFSIEPIETEKPSSKDTTPSKIADKPSYRMKVSQAEVPESLASTKNTTEAKASSTPTPDEEELKKATVVDDSDDEDLEKEDTPSGGSGGKILMLGAVCALAAGAFFYAKKHNIQKEEIVRNVNDMVKKVQDRIQERFSKK